MKILKASAMAGILALSGLAHAEFQYSFSAPSNVIAGEAATFALHVTYTPWDVTSFNSENSQFLFQNFSAYSWTRFELFEGGNSLGLASNEFGEITSIINGTKSPTGVLYGDVDPSLPLDYDFNFALTFATEGDYSIRTFARNDEYIYYSRSPSCLANPVCNVGINYSDVSSRKSGYDNVVSFTVSAVPEPETYVLMLAGLGLIGVVTRRRDNRASKI